MPNRVLLFSGNQDEKINEKNKSPDFKGTMRGIQHLLTDQKVMKARDSSALRGRGWCRQRPRVSPSAPADKFHSCCSYFPKSNMKWRTAASVCSSETPEGAAACHRVATATEDGRTTPNLVFQIWELVDIMSLILIRHYVTEPFFLERRNIHFALPKSNCSFSPTAVSACWCFLILPT